MKWQDAESEPGYPRDRDRERERDKDKEKDKDKDKSASAKVAENGPVAAPRSG
jgi:hypothetical protein